MPATGYGVPPVTYRFGQPQRVTLWSVPRVHSTKTDPKDPDTFCERCDRWPGGRFEVISPRRSKALKGRHPMLPLMRPNKAETRVWLLGSLSRCADSLDVPVHLDRLAVTCRMLVTGYGIHYTNLTGQCLPWSCTSLAPVRGCRLGTAGSGGRWIPRGARL